MRRDAAAPPFDEQFNYRKVVGNINFLEKSIRPYIAYPMYQCTRFSQDPRASHGNTIIHLVKYLKSTKRQGITLDPEGNKIFELYTKENFCGNWN